VAPRGLSSLLSARISETCEDVGACDDSGRQSPVSLRGSSPRSPARRAAPTTTSPIKYVADLWLVPAIGAAFPQLSQDAAWTGPIAYDTGAKMAFVASGGSVIALGPERDDLAPFRHSSKGEIVGMAAAAAPSFSRPGTRVYEWKPDQGRKALERVDPGDESQVLQHVFLGDADDPGSG
jgi:hypothetical protein